MENINIRACTKQQIREFESQELLKFKDFKLDVTPVSDDERVYLYDIKFDKIRLLYNVRKNGKPPVVIFENGLQYVESLQLDMKKNYVQFSYNNHFTIYISTDKIQILENNNCKIIEQYRFNN